MTQDLINKAEKIKQELLSLQQKGYGKTDVSQIPKGVDISTLPAISPQPLPDGEPNNLLTFKETLSKITNLAKEKRNALSLEFMAPFSGIAPASDFNSILSNLNRASDTFSQDITKDIFKGQETKYELRNVGDDLMEFELDASGKVKSSRVVASEPKPTDIEDISIKDLKKKADKMFGDLSSKIVLKLNDEQLRKFMSDFDATEQKLNASVDVGQFFDEWKKQVGIKDTAEKGVKEQIMEFLPKQKEAGFSKKEARELLLAKIEKSMGIIPKSIKGFIDEELEKLYQ